MDKVKYINEDVKLENGIDNIFFKLLRNLYSPMLSTSHMKDRYKYTIFIDGVKYPVGIISINKGKNNFMQFALIPQARGRGIAQTALKKIVKIAKVKRVDWGCKKNNYPSLKILYDFNGGIFDNVVKDNRRKSYEGFFCVNKDVSKNMRNNLLLILPESRKRYFKWLELEYNKRLKEQNELNAFLKEYTKWK